MIDQNKRKTLKIIASTGGLTVGAAAFPVFAKTLTNTHGSNTGIEITVQHSSVFDSNYLLVKNTAATANTVRFQSQDTIDLPTGRYSLERIAKMGPIELSPGATRLYVLDDRVGALGIDKEQIGHNDLRYPISSGLTIGSLEVASKSNGVFSAPVLMESATVYS